LRLRVEHVLADRGIVLARPIEIGAFQLTPTATLDGRPVAHLDLPRALDDDGTPDLELVGFFLAYAADAARFRVGAEAVYSER